MPMATGSSDAVIAENIREMVNAGRPQDQAIAAAYRMAGKSRKKKKSSAKRPTNAPVRTGPSNVDNQMSGRRMDLNPRDYDEGVPKNQLG